MNEELKKKFDKIDEDLTKIEDNLKIIASLNKLKLPSELNKLKDKKE